MRLGVYFHVPFCRKKCDYCNFYSENINTLPDFAQIRDIYTDKMINEINTRLPQLYGYTVDTVYFGGGTPSLLNVENVQRLITALKKYLPFDTDVEISFEMNPEDMLPDYIDNLKQTGVNRIILGVQTIDHNAALAIGRSAAHCSPETIEQFCEIPDLIHCIDIIGAIPWYTKKKYFEDIHNILAYDIQHISVYLLTLEKHTPLYKKLITESDDEFSNDVYRQTITVLARYGFNHYEISNFAKNGLYSRHNMKYWKFMPYIGFGSGAHSFYNRKRYMNTMSLKDYLVSQPCVVEDKRSRQGEMVEYLLTGLRLMEGIDLKQMSTDLQSPIPKEVYDAICLLQKNGLLTCESERIALTGEGIIVADSVIYTLVEPML